jgi:hypothetical protein
MVPKSLAFGLLVGSCVAAAGGGAYLATLHHAPSTAATTPSLSTPAVTPTPQAVASNQPKSAIPAIPYSSVEQGAPELKLTPATSGAARTAIVKKPEPKATAGTDGNVDVPATVSHPSEPASANQGSAPPIVPVNPPVTAPAAGDPGVLAQRPWPGPPASALPVPPASAASESARSDGEGQARDSAKLWEELVVPTESVLGLQLQSTLNTEQARVEDRVETRVTRDVRVNGRAAIRAGSHVIGSVMLVERGGKMKDRARIGIRFHTLVLTDGTTMSITTDTVYRESESPGNKASAKIGGAAIGGAIIGAIIGGGKGAAIGSGIGAAGGTAAAMTAERMAVVMPAGTNVSVRTLAPIAVVVEK